MREMPKEMQQCIDALYNIVVLGASRKPWFKPANGICAAWGKFCMYHELPHDLYLSGGWWLNSAFLEYDNGVFYPFDESRLHFVADSCNGVLWQNPKRLHFITQHSSYSKHNQAGGV